MRTSHLRGLLAPDESWPKHAAGSQGALWYWSVGGAFIILYVLIEGVTFVHQIDGLGITLWSPSAGASMAFLLLAGPRFAPFVFVASLITDYAIYTGPRGLIAPIGTSLVLALGLAALALALSTAWGSRRVSLSRVLATLLIVPIGTLLTAIFYCLVLFACELLAADRFAVAARNFWIGDTLGIVTLMPAALTALDLSVRRQAPSRSELVSAFVFGSLLLAALWIIFGLRRSHEYQFFYLVFIPVVWIAVRAGYAGVSLALPVVHVLIVSIAISLGYAVSDFVAFQMLMLVLSASGLLLGAAVTEARTSAERMRSQERELARAARHALVGATGTALAHEISQPLASTTNYLHAARRILLESKGSRHLDAAATLAKAEAEARRVRETLERVRDYISSGRVELSEVDIEAVAGKIASVLGREDGRGVRIEVSSVPQLPLVRGDAIQLEQLLLNLMGNAVDAAKSDAPEHGLVRVRILQRGDRVLVEVDDSGPGVAPDVADRLFEPFETSKPNGMGLGLTLARQIVEAHAGQLHWQNLPGGGARFAVELRIEGPYGHGR